MARAAMEGSGVAGLPSSGAPGYAGGNDRINANPKPMSTSQSPAANFSHVVIFWTDPAQPHATEELVAGANKYLKDIPGLVHFHVGKMVGSARPVVDQSYQVALNTVFTSKQAQDDYQVHPQHIEFVEKVFKKVCKKVVVYDFQ